MITIPAQWARTGENLPAVCSRHGLAATRKLRTYVVSVPPAWSYLVLLVGLLPFWIVRIATKKDLHAQRWPFCQRCLRLQLLRMSLGFSGLIAGVALIGLAVTEDVGGPRNLLSGLFLMIVGYAGLLWSAKGHVAKARVSQDGDWVEVVDPAGDFKAEMEITIMGIERERRATIGGPASL